MSGHSWAKHEREGWTVCTVCGAVRNYDRPASSCRGAVKVALREATGGEQGPGADELEVAKPDLEELCDVLDACGARLRLGEQSPSSDELEIASLRRELDKLGADRHDALARRRAAAQILIAEIGASGPESVEETARRAVERIQELKSVTEDLCMTGLRIVTVRDLRAILSTLRTATTDSIDPRSTIGWRAAERLAPLVGFDGLPKATQLREFGFLPGETP